MCHVNIPLTDVSIISIVVVSHDSNDLRPLSRNDRDLYSAVTGGVITGIHREFVIFTLPAVVTPAPLQIETLSSPYRTRTAVCFAPKITFLTFLQNMR